MMKGRLEQSPAPYASALSLARGTRLAADITGGSVSARGLKRAFEKPILVITFVMTDLLGLNDYA